MRLSRLGMLVFGLATTFAAMPSTAVAGGNGEVECENVNFQVSPEGVPGTYNMVGTLCRPKNHHQQTLQILIHGASYNRAYWDFPFMAQQYSYVRQANAAGFATLAVDRLGTGDSDRPTPELVSVHAAASTIHQIVTAMRNGTVADASGHKIEFHRVVLVGHSFGSNISWTEAGIYGDVDGLVLTAISHDQNPPGAPLTVTDAWPAAFDPKFASLGLPLGYLTTIPGTRAELFYYLPGADPNVIAVDEQVTKDTLPVGMLFDQFTTYGLTQNIHVPVLNVVGNFDTLACQLPSCTASGSIANEGSFYPPDACYTQLIVPDTGHATNLHLASASWFATAQQWIANNVRPGNGHHGTCAGQ